MVIQAWVFGRDFLENELGEPVISMEQLTVFIAKGKIQGFK